jgi:chromate reductase
MIARHRHANEGIAFLPGTFFSTPARLALADNLRGIVPGDNVSTSQDHPTLLQEPVMSKYQIAVIVGSLRRESFNRQLANAIVKLAPAHFAFKQIVIGDLPLYNQDDDSNQAASVKRLKADITASQGLIFVTPEYNRSIPGVLKNAIDHASRPYGQSAWAGKPAGVIGISVGPMGTSMAQQHLRNVLAVLDMPTLGQPEMFLQAKEGLFDSSGNVGEGSRKFMQSWMDRYVAWVTKHAG